MSGCPSPPPPGHEGPESRPPVPPHYATLGVAPSIAQSDLARHYKRLSLELHPDRAAYRDNLAAEADVRDRFQRITAAYAVLSDPQRRTAYDTQHGVNLHSRIARVRDALRAAQESPTRVASGGVGEKRDRGELQGLDVSRHRAASAAAHAERADTDESDDEVYVPASHATVRCAFDAGGASSPAQLFSLYPRSGTTASILRQVTIAPLPLAIPASASITEDDAVWEARYGIVTRGAVLTRASVAGVPFPALIRIVNGVAMNAGDSLIKVLARTHAGLRDTPTRPEADGMTPADELSPPPSRSETLLPTLELTLAYSTEVFDLVGDTTKLCHPAVRDVLVPGDGAAPAVVAIRPDASVVAVNGESVESAAELRDRLAALVSPQTTEGEGSVADDMSKHRPRAIWLELSVLDRAT